MSIFVFVSFSAVNGKYISVGLSYILGLHELLTDRVDITLRSRSRDSSSREEGTRI